MNFYQAAVLKIRDEHYPPPYLINRVVQAKYFIDNHSTAGITLDEIAGSACLSKFHFIRLFKKCYGITPYQYLTEKRIAKAKQLLQSGLTVAETCYALGFVSTTSFTGLFKKNTGRTPAHYCQSLQTNLGSNSSYPICQPG